MFDKINLALMITSKNKIKLAPRLRWGVGRDTNKISFFKLGGALFLTLSAVLVIRAGWLLFSPNQEASPANPQVLGEVDKADTSELFTEYKVKPGDTLFTIAQDHNVEWTMLATINNLKAPFTLHTDQTIKIPKS